MFFLNYNYEFDCRVRNKVIGENMMRVKLFYPNIPSLGIQKISVIGTFNNFDPNKNFLHKEEDGWSTEIELPVDKYLYKFIIDDFIKLNDPLAYTYLVDEKGEAWSILTVQKEDMLLSKSIDENIRLNNYIINNRMFEQMKYAQSKKEFSLKIDRKVVCTIEFQNIVGVHPITIIWYRPDMKIHHISEHILEIHDGEYNIGAITWFWIDLTEPNREYPLGGWTIRMFIDGAFSFQDYFNIGSSGTYILSK